MIRCFSSQHDHETERPIAVWQIDDGEFDCGQCLSNRLFNMGPGESISIRRLILKEQDQA